MDAGFDLERSQMRVGPSIEGHDRAGEFGAGRFDWHGLLHFAQTQLYDRSDEDITLSEVEKINT